MKYAASSNLRIKYFTLPATPILKLAGLTSTYNFMYLREFMFCNM